MTTLTFRVAGVPVPWARTRVVTYPRLRFVNPAASRDWQDQLASAAAIAMRKQGWKLATGMLTVSMIVYRPIAASTPLRRAELLAGTPCPVRPDADNYLKQLDALNGVAWKDDAQIVDARVRKVWAAPEDAGVTVEVEMFTEAGK